MPNFEYALLALLAIGFLSNTGIVLWGRGSKPIPEGERLRTAALSLFMDTVLIVCCLLYY